MLSTPKLKIIQELIAGSTREELIWLNGYLAGIVTQVPGLAGQPAQQNLANQQGQSVQQGSPAQQGPSPQQGSTGQQGPSALAQVQDPASRPSVQKITIAYGTETGNSKKLAADFAAKAKKKGINAKLVGLEQYRLADLAKEEYFFTVISTQGDGEPPASARKFYDHIHQGGLRLEKLKYGVLALGDTAYPLFCQAGEDVDQQFSKIGGQRIVALRKCDIDYEDRANTWFEEILQRLSTNGTDNTGNGSIIANGAGSSTGNGSIARTTASPRKKTYTGTILANINLNDRGSSKRTHHLEITSDDADYQPGDSIGITPENPAATVDAILSLSGIDPAAMINYRDEDLTISGLLRKKLNIIYLPERVVRKYAGIVKQDIPETRIGLLDLLKIYPVKDAAQFIQVIGILEPIAPRLYSISSSPEAHAGEIHITVAKDTFSVNGEAKHGLCSDILSRLSPEETLDFYIHKNSQFKLPAPDKDIIMIGPGTGIAPFRSFLAERDAIGAQGKNWLFFGDQHFTTDFLYQTEIQNWIQTGVLTKVNTAFSRDQSQKVYVQHKMQARAADFFEWLESGAYIYLCGAKDPMSIDVEKALVDIIRSQGQMTQGRADSYLDELKESGRFLRDVY